MLHTYSFDGAYLYMGTIDLLYSHLAHTAYVHPSSSTELLALSLSRSRLTPIHTLVFGQNNFCRYTFLRDIVKRKKNTRCNFRRFLHNNASKRRDVSPPSIILRIYCECVLYGTSSLSVKIPAKSSSYYNTMYIIHIYISARKHKG